MRIEKGPFTAAEIRRVLKKAKNNKAAGPDDIPIQLYKLMDDTQLEELATLFTEVLMTAKPPEEENTARVVEIYKGKGTHSDPDMYRPISLLSTSYKIFREARTG